MISPAFTIHETSQWTASMPIKQTRGPQVGKCNICGEVGPLTVDHCPPKGWAPRVPLRVSEVMAPYRDGSKFRYQKFNNGVQFRSLCERCNRDILGTRYDPELISLVEKVTALTTSVLHIPALQYVRLRPQRIMRSVIGHLCSQGVDRFHKGELTEVLKNYLTDPTAKFPNSLSLCYWLFPHPGVVLTRDYSITRLGCGSASMLWIMKCFPLGFALINRGYAFDGVPPQMVMDDFGDLGDDDQAELPIALINYPPRHFPEHPSSNSAIFAGPQSTMANASPPRPVDLSRIKK